MAAIVCVSLSVVLRVSSDDTDVLFDLCTFDAYHGLLLALLDVSYSGALQIPC